MLSSLVVPWLLSLLLFELTTAITYRCDDDQILVVQSFGNDTIRMHCQKPTLCGFQHLKCHYEPLQPYCGGRNNFVAHVQQLTPVALVTHTCCNLTLSEDRTVPTHTGNDCFLYDLPDGSNETAAEQAEKADEEGYTLLKNINKIPEQFEGYSGYRLRLYLLRNKEPSQLVVKGIERNEIGYRVTICRTLCQKIPDEEEAKKPVAHDEHHRHDEEKQQQQSGPDKKDGGIIDGSGTKRIELTLRNLTDDGRWLVAAWTEWSYKQWSQWSRLQWTDFDKLPGTRLRGGRHRSQRIEADKGSTNDEEEDRATETGKNVTQEKLRTPARHKIVVDEGDKELEEVPSDQPVPGRAHGVKTSRHSARGRHHHHRAHPEEDSDECDDDNYYDDEEKGKSEIAHEEKRKPKGHQEKRPITETITKKNRTFGSITIETKTEARKAGSVAVGTGEKGKNFTGDKGFDLFAKIGEEDSSETSQQPQHHASTASGTSGGDISRAKEDEGKSTAESPDRRGSVSKETDNLKAREDEGKSTAELPERRGSASKETDNLKAREDEGKSTAELPERRGSASKETDNLKAREDEGKSTAELPERRGSASKETDTSKAREDEGKSTAESSERRGSASKETNTLKAKEDEGDTSSAAPASGSKESDAVKKITEERTKKFEGRRHPASDTIDPDYIARRNTSQPAKFSATEEKVLLRSSASKKTSEFIAKETVGAGDSSSSSRSKESATSGETVHHQKITETSRIAAKEAGSEESSAKGAELAVEDEGTPPKSESRSAEMEGKPEAEAAVVVNAPDSDNANAEQEASAAPLDTKAFAARNCFSADTKVYTQRGEKAMKELEVGDFVLVPVSKTQLRYERVEMFYHREPETRAKFVVLETESGRKLSLTELHLLPQGDCQEMHRSMTEADGVEEWLRKSKFAYKVRVGDCVLSIGTNHELQVDRIRKVGRQYLKGIYSPMTVEGSIVTDGILASCFSQVESHFGQKLVYDFLISLYRVFGRVMLTLDEPIQHLPSFIDSVHHLSRYVVPFVKY